MTTDNIQGLETLEAWKRAKDIRECLISLCDAFPDCQIWKVYEKCSSFRLGFGNTALACGASVQASKTELLNSLLRLKFARKSCPSCPLKKNGVSASKPDEQSKACPLILRKVMEGFIIKKQFDFAISRAGLLRKHILT